MLSSMLRENEGVTQAKLAPLGDDALQAGMKMSPRVEGFERGGFLVVVFFGSLLFVLFC